MNHSWTAEEDSKLAKLYLNKADARAYEAEFPDIPPSCIYARRCKLGLVSSRKRWSEEEDKKLLRLYPLKNVNWREEFPHRTKSAIQVRAKMLGLEMRAKRHRWSTNDDEFIRNNYAIHGKEWEGWKQLGSVTWASIRQRASRLKIRRHNTRAFNSKEKQMLIDALNKTARELEASAVDVVKAYVAIARKGLIGVV